MLQLRQLQQERLERSALEDGEWRDLTPEQIEEEAVLMKIIQGKDIRLKYCSEKNIRLE